VSRLQYLLGYGADLGLDSDTMENWDEDKLRKVVLSKAGNPRTTTDVFFVSLVINSFCANR